MDIDWSAPNHQMQTPATAGVLSELGNTEDSGYHTPFTPGSFELSGALDASSDGRSRIGYIFARRRGSTSVLRSRFERTRSRTPTTEENSSGAINGSPAASGSSEPLRWYEPIRRYEPNLCSPQRRRPPKRSLEEVEEQAWCLEVASTPTTVITGDLQKLVVTDESTPYLEVSAREERSRRDLATSDYFSLSSIPETSKPLSYPTTPVKSSRCKKAKYSSRGEKRSCNKNYSPTKATKENFHPRRSVKKLSFALPLKDPNNEEPPKPQRPTVIPDKKFDLITKLDKGNFPMLRTILEFLDGADLHNFSRVSRTWEAICVCHPKVNVRLEQYMEFINVTKENHNNRHSIKRVTRACDDTDSDKQPGILLRDIHNLINGRQNNPTPSRSPPRTPRSTKFRNFTKSASLDTRVQLSCVRCGLPAKVTEERGGEQWAQCSSDSCSFSFCRFCNCARHPGKKCFQYSLEAPSPSKRFKRSSSVTGTSKSKKNLRRLLL